MTSRYFAPLRPRLYAHRGSAGTHPENTLPAFAAARTAGIEYLELDVWATADRQVIVHHDPTTGRLCDRDLPVSLQSLATLRELDAGYGFSPDGENFPFRGRGLVIPTLEEVLQAFPECCINIEIKQETPPIEALVVETIARAQADDRVLLAAEKDAIMAPLRPLCAARGIPTSLSYGELAAFYAWLGQGAPPGYRPPGQALQIPPSYAGEPLVSREILAIAHALGLEVHVWTINEERQMRRLLEWGVDGLMSDFPERLLRVVRGI